MIVSDVSSCISDKGNEEALGARETRVIPKIQINPIKDIRTYASATSHAFYEENAPVLLDLFDRSLLAHKGRYSPLKVQVELLQNILLSDRARKAYERDKQRYGRAVSALVKGEAPQERIKLGSDRLREANDGLISARWLADRMRVIGNGMAWRLLDYDRAALRLLADHPPVSIPEANKGLATEIEELIRIVREEEHPVLLNAVTEFLRIGDITVKDRESGRVELVEIKAGPKRDSRSIRQTHHRTLAQEDLDSGILSIGAVKIRKIVADKPLKTHVRSVEQAMIEAEERLGASRKFDDYLTVGVLDLRKAVDTLVEEEWAGVWRPISERLFSVKGRPSDILLPVMDNLFAISHFLPNMAPYTVFPIAPRFRLALMLGDLLVMSLLNVSGLARWLAKRGWETEVLEPSDKIPDDGDFPDIGVLRVGRGGMSVELGLNVLMVAALEFWMPESIEESVEAVMRSLPPRHSEEPAIYSQVTFPNSGKYAWD